jgi:peptidoglycan/xylan/chitin deacetylase (PgdA/CDA1 family)
MTGVRSDRVLARLGEGLLPRRRFEQAAWLGGPAQTLTFDDGKASDIDRMAPLLEAAGVKGVFAPTTSLIGEPGYFGAAELQGLVQQGHEIASHLDQHVALIERTPAAADEGLSRSKAVLEELAGATVGSVIYPFGASSRAVRAAAAAAQYGLGFSAWPGTTAGRFNRFAVRRLAFGSFTRAGRDTDAYFRRVVETVVEQRRWLVLMVHSAAAAQPAEHDAQLRDLLAFAAERGLPVRTAAEAEAAVSARRP